MAERQPTASAKYREKKKLANKTKTVTDWYLVGWFQFMFVPSLGYIDEPVFVLVSHSFSIYFLLFMIIIGFMKVYVCCVNFCSAF